MDSLDTFDVTMVGILQEQRMNCGLCWENGEKKAKKRMLSGMFVTIIQSDGHLVPPPPPPPPWLVTTMGAVEAMVKSVKATLNKIVKNNILSEEDYRTVLCQITTCVNSRPLWPSTDGSVDQPIKRIDLLRPAGLPRDPENMNLTCNPRKRYQFIQNLVNEWWSLWMAHFVPNLQPRGKWFKRRENLSVSDIVLVMEKDVSRSKWNMGIINKVYPGPDGLVRSANVKTLSGT